MCGRYNLATDSQTLVDSFDLVNQLNWKPRYNISPSQEIPAVRQGRAGREGVLLRWGLIPHWAKDEKFGYRTINARAETVAEKPAFRSAFRKRRCLIPATGFYEWRKVDNIKQPYNIRVKDADLFAFAGLWERWVSSEGDAVESCTIIVTEANEALSHIHDRMPVILESDDYDTWLDSDLQDVEAVKPLLRSWPEDWITFYPVSRRVGRPDNDDPSLLKPLE
jgi:putative SOS response-associated peptidase YedK